MASVNYETPITGALLNVDEVARALGMSPRTIRNWMALGKLRYFKMGRSTRISENEVLEIIARSHRTGGQSR